MTTFWRKRLKSPVGSADNRRVGNYDEMSTARLTWVVLDRLVPAGDEATARAALIARDPKLASLVARGVLSEHEAIETLRLREAPHRGSGGRAPLIAPALVLLVLIGVAWLVVTGF
jgi:hypothetical protein